MSLPEKLDIDEAEFDLLDKDGARDVLRLCLVNHTYILTYDEELGSFQSRGIIDVLTYVRSNHEHY